MTTKVKAIIATILIMLILIALAILHIMFIEVAMFLVGLGVFILLVAFVYKTMFEIFED